MVNLDNSKLEKVAGGVGGTNYDPAEMEAGMAYREKADKLYAGMPNPITGVSFEEAMKKAKELGSERKDMGGWYQMNDVDYLKWWSKSNTDLYEAHKNEIDAIIGINK